MLEWIHRFAVSKHFIMQVGAGRIAGAAHETDHIASFNRLPDFDIVIIEVTVSGGVPVAMIDSDHLAQTAVDAH